MLWKISARLEVLQLMSQWCCYRWYKVRYGHSSFVCSFSACRSPAYSGLQRVGRQ